MPQLAEEILKRNDKAKADGLAPVINFSGFLVGNPYTDARSNQVRMVLWMFSSNFFFFMVGWWVG